MIFLIFIKDKMEKKKYYRYSVMLIILITNLQEDQFQNKYSNRGNNFKLNEISKNS